MQHDVGSHPKFWYSYCELWIYTTWYLYKCIRGHVYKYTTAYSIYSRIACTHQHWRFHGMSSWMPSWAAESSISHCKLICLMWIMNGNKKMRQSFTKLTIFPPNFQESYHCKTARISCTAALRMARPPYVLQHLLSLSQAADLGPQRHGDVGNGSNSAGDPFWDGSEADPFKGCCWIMVNSN